METRVETLARKLLLPENSSLIPKASKWVYDSIAWSSSRIEEEHPDASGEEREELVKRYRLKYILNHLCPSLHHFKPSPSQCLPYQDIAKCSREYTMENSQAEFVDINGKVLQAGVIRSGEQMDKLLHT